MNKYQHCVTLVPFQAISSSPAASPGSGVLQLSGTTDLDQLGKSLREGVSSLASFAATGLITAVLVTGLVYLAVGTTLATTRRRNGKQVQTCTRFYIKLCRI